nr:HEPN domain-containing protein [Sphingobium boeckii]
MRNDLDHLPEDKQRELERAVQILFEEFADSLMGRSAPHRKAGRILKIILFGSFARGGWVDDRKSGQVSDYDLLVIVNHEELTENNDYWSSAGDRLVREFAIAKSFRHPVHFIVHELGDVRRQLKRGRPFFRDIVRDGIVLYEAEGFELPEPEILSEQEMRAEAQEYFDTWFPRIGEALDLAQFAVTRGNAKDAAFLLHQATERAYHCALLVLTLYSPKSHRLEELRSRAEGIEPRLFEVWPRDDKFKRRCFDRIRRAYVEARYSKLYKITDEEMTFAIEHIEQLQALVAIVCAERLEI